MISDRCRLKKYKQLFTQEPYHQGITGPSMGNTLSYNTLLQGRFFF